MGIYTAQRIWGGSMDHPHGVTYTWIETKMTESQKNENPDFVN